MLHVEPGELSLQGFARLLAERGGGRGRTETYRLSGTLRAPALSPKELADVVLQVSDAGPIANSDVRAATGFDRAEALGLLDRLLKRRASDA